MGNMDLIQQKILVTGGAGFLGRYVVNRLEKLGVPKESIAIPSASEFDLRFYENCERAVYGKDLVIHLAGVTGNSQFHKTHPASIFYDNLMMGVHLMEAARRAGVKKFVSIGSATEYPADAPLPYQEENLWNGPPDQTNFAYSVAKRMLLTQGQAYRAQYGFNAVHLLPDNMFGPGEKFENGFVIPSTIKKIAEAQSQNSDFIICWGTGKAKREFLYVEDAAEGVVLAAQKYDKPDPVNLGSGEEISIRDLVTAIAELMNFKGEIRWDATKPDGQLRRNLDVSRAEREFGFRAKTGIREGLKKTVAWHLKTMYK